MDKKLVDLLTDMFGVADFFPISSGVMLYPGNTHPILAARAQWICRDGRRFTVTYHGTWVQIDGPRGFFMELCMED